MITLADHNHPGAFHCKGFQHSETLQRTLAAILQGQYKKFPEET